ncbi:MAG TPA: glutaminyl-peptide cyclotransferase [Parafilimonas sp.]|nr:glutaminyl-peptide cyclotransferase [Parafilimonas sp.]
MKKIVFAVFLLLLFAACNNHKPTNPVVDSSNPAPPVLNYSVVKVYPHDTSSYTQGLQWLDSSLYEGTGNYGSSKLIKEHITDGKAEKEISLDKSFFGEGITVMNNKIYQLTWKENKVFVYDASTFKKINELTWPFEGWGLTNNGKEIIVSTGSSNLYFVDPETFKIIRQVGVTDNYGPVALLNELEYANGSIYANQYETDYILKINATTGKVEGKMDCSKLLAQSGLNFNPDEYSVNTGYVLNGIAYDSAKNSFYITGKMWPALFEIKLN